jgi:uncharacterized repeat protein (TIGR03803 family)
MQRLLSYSQVILIFAAIGLAVALSIVVPPNCQAQAPTAAVTIFHSFGDGSVANDGLYPVAALIQGTDGNLYGTTQEGGSSAFGTVFKITLTGDLTILHSFRDGSVANDGLSPTADLMQGPDGNFYGTTSGGGSTNSGTVFAMTPAGTVTILHKFLDGSVNKDGWNPRAGLVMGSDGDLYGTASNGGVSNNGIAFKITTLGQLTILHWFGDGSVPNDAVFPESDLILGSDGNFYGTGGSVATNGAVFKMTPAGGITILHSFGDGSVLNDGASPVGGLVEGADGNFYGTTFEGGFNDDNGTLFKVSAAGNYALLYLFGNQDLHSDGNPEGGLIIGPDGNFYGTTSLGGVSVGSIFQMTSGGRVTNLHSFGDQSVPNDGLQPVARLVQAKDGNLYGTTWFGGTASRGTVFKVTLTAPTTINFPAGLQMLSLPYTYHGVSLDSLLGYTGATLATWQPATSEYAITPTAPADQFRWGQSYWVRFPQAVSITLPGAPADTSKNFDIPLTKGWNMIGDPFLASIPVSSLLFNHGTETFVQAIDGTNPLIGAAIWSYSQASSQYTPATSLDPDQGYWILAFANTDVRIPHP